MLASFRRATAIGAAVLLGAGAIGFASRAPARAARADNASASIMNFAFAPQTISINAGDAVTWINYDMVGHTVTSDDGTTFDSRIDSPPSLSTGDIFIQIFNSPGTYTYHCAIHSYMTGTVIVN